jgi:hypothetical protein
MLKNWKTSLIGISGFILTVLNHIAPIIPEAYSWILPAATTMIGLLHAKDAETTPSK